MNDNPDDWPQPNLLCSMAAMRGSFFSLLLLALLLDPRTSQAQTEDLAVGGPVEPPARIQVLDGRILQAGLQLYRVTGLKRGQTLDVYAKGTCGHLDPLVALLKPSVRLEELGDPLTADRPEKG